MQQCCYVIASIYIASPLSEAVVICISSTAATTVPLSVSSGDCHTAHMLKLAMPVQISSTLDAATAVCFVSKDKHGAGLVCLGTC